MVISSWKAVRVVHVYSTIKYLGYIPMLQWLLINRRLIEREIGDEKGVILVCNTIVFVALI